MTLTDRRQVSSFTGNTVSIGNITAALSSLETQGLLDVTDRGGDSPQSQKRHKLTAAGYSKAHFVRLFRRTTGTSPHRYVLHRRLEEARHLIVSTALPLAEVASETGFASQSHLNNAFVRRYGCTPGEARREAAA